MMNFSLLISTLKGIQGNATVVFSVVGLCTTELWNNQFSVVWFPAGKITLSDNPANVKDEDVNRLQFYCYEPQHNVGYTICNE